MNWWRRVRNPLGASFTLAPEDYFVWPKDKPEVANTYIGYSLEKTCLKTPYIPWDQRPRQIYVLAKWLKIFLYPKYVLTDPNKNYWNHLTDTFYLDLSKSLNVSFHGQFTTFEAPPNVTQPPPGISQLARMSRPDFQKTIASSRVMMGIGSPLLSPSPWEALCLGVPFINPIYSWNKQDPDDRQKWAAQHDALVQYGIDEPYVYHVKIGDRAGLERAIRKAVETPIERYVPPKYQANTVKILIMKS